MPANSKSKKRRVKKVSKLPTNTFKNDARYFQKLEQLSSKFSKLMQKSKTSYSQASVLLSKFEKENDVNERKKINDQISQVLAPLEKINIREEVLKLKSELERYYKVLTSVDEIDELIDELNNLGT